MPSYEAAVIIRAVLARPELKNTMMRVCQHIHNRGGLIRSMENLGQKELPYPMKVHRIKNTHGNYMCIKFDSSAETMQGVQYDLKLDKDIIRCGVIRNEEEPTRPCEEGACIFGELPNPDHDRSAYKRKVLKRFKNRHV